MKAGTAAIAAVVGLGVVGGVALVATRASAKAPNKLPAGRDPNSREPAKKPEKKPAKKPEKKPAKPAKPVDDARAKAEEAARRAAAEDKRRKAEEANKKPKLEPGMKAVKVLGAQKLLLRLGARNLAGPNTGTRIDGLFGKRTQAAWQAAAKNHKLVTTFDRIDGKNAAANERTARLLADIANQRPAVETSHPEQKPAVSTTDKPAKPTPINASKVSVLRAQKALNSLGASPALKTDGTFGPKTKAAWVAAAQKRSLPTGFTAVNGDPTLAIAATAAIKTILADGEGTTPAPKPATDKPKVVTVEGAKVSVLRAQKALNTLGASPALKTDGTFGPKTKAAWGAAAQKRSLPAGFAAVNGDPTLAIAAADTVKRILAEGEGAPPKATPSSPPPAVNVPPGFDRKKAKATASELAAHIRKSGRAYDRKKLATWQKYAGLVQDGAYGPKTVSALHFYGVANPPTAMVSSRDPDTSYRPAA